MRPAISLLSLVLVKLVLSLLADDLRLMESLIGGFSVTAFTELFLDTLFLGSVSFSRMDEVFRRPMVSLSSTVLVKTVFLTLTLEIGTRSSSITD